MDSVYTIMKYDVQGESFEWDDQKAKTNFSKHGVSFLTAAEVFFDPFVITVDASPMDAAREAAIGFDFSEQLLYVVFFEKETAIRIISARPATAAERRRYDSQ